MYSKPHHNRRKVKRDLKEELNLLKQDGVHYSDKFLDQDEGQEHRDFYYDSAKLPPHCINVGDILYMNEKILGKKNTDEQRVSHLYLSSKIAKISDIDIQQDNDQRFHRGGDLYKQFYECLDHDDGLHFSHLGGDILRASSSLVSEFSGVVCLLLWSAFSDGSFSILGLPVVNCSEHDQTHIVAACNWLVQYITELVENDMKFYNVEECLSPQEALFYCLTISIVRMKSKALSLLSGKLGPSKFYNRRLALQGSFQKPKPCLDVNLGSDIVGVYEAADKAEREHEIMSLERRCVLIEHDEYSCGYCMICYDDLQKNASTGLAACGHKFCSNCWRELMRSAKSSGDVVIKCPGIRCNGGSICKRDCAHILFTSYDPENNRSLNELNDRLDIIIGLVRFQLENYAVKQKMKFCQSPGCPGIFNRNVAAFIATRNLGASEYGGKGIIIEMCCCGASACMQCLGPSHVGTSCAAFAHIQRDFKRGGLNDEVRSVALIQKTSSPCPMCGFCIVKDGGCNHVMCAKCVYYFCWECKGDGAVCGAFVCKQKSVSIEHYESRNPDYQRERSSDDTVIKLYALVQKGLDKLLRRSSSNEISCCHSLLSQIEELHLLQVLSWALASCLSQIQMHDSFKSLRVEKLLNKIRDLKLILDISQRKIPHLSQNGRNSAESIDVKLMALKMLDKRSMSVYLAQALESLQKVMLSRSYKARPNVEYAYPDHAFLNKRQKPRNASWKNSRPH